MKPTSLTPAEVPEVGAARSSSENVIASFGSCLQSCIKVSGDTPALPFDSRISAGRLLGRFILVQRNPPEPLVLALSPGAAQVARGVAESLRSPVDLLFSQDVCLPWQQDIVLATVNSDGGRTVDEAVCRSLRLSRYFVYNCIAKAESDLQRRIRACRGAIPSLPRLRKRILLVDDGEAKPSHLMASIKSLHKQDAAEIIFGAPFAALESIRAIADGVNFCMLLAISDPLRPGSAYYTSFPQVSDDQIREILKPQKPVESVRLRSAVAAGY